MITSNILLKKSVSNRRFEASMGPKVKGLVKGGIRNSSSINFICDNKSEQKVNALGKDISNLCSDSTQTVNFS